MSKETVYGVISIALFFIAALVAAMGDRWVRSAVDMALAAVVALRIGRGENECAVTHLGQFKFKRIPPGPRESLNRGWP